MRDVQAVLVGRKWPPQGGCSIHPIDSDTDPSRKSVLEDAKSKIVSMVGCRVLVVRCHVGVIWGRVRVRNAMGVIRGRVRMRDAVLMVGGRMRMRHAVGVKDILPKSVQGNITAYACGFYNRRYLTAAVVSRVELPFLFGSRAVPRGIKHDVLMRAAICRSGNGRSARGCTAARGGSRYA